MPVPNLLGSLIGRSCTHEFLWPHRDSDGSYHQACARCGKHFAFDWRAMTRSEKIAQRVSPIAQRVGTLVPRAHRFIFGLGATQVVDALAHRAGQSGIAL